MPEPATADIWADVLPKTVDLPYRQQGRSPPVCLEARWPDTGDTVHQMFEVWETLCAQARQHAFMPTSRFGMSDGQMVYFQLCVAGRN